MRFEVIQSIAQAYKNAQEDDSLGQLETLVDMACERVGVEVDHEIRKSLMKLIVFKHNRMKNGPTKKESLIRIILLICKEIRLAMHKEMRIFCSELLMEISNVDEEIVGQMMQKEEFTFSQKFSQIGSVNE